MEANKYSQWLERVNLILDDSGSERINLRPLSEVSESCISKKESLTRKFNLPLWPLFTKMLGGLRPNEFSIISGPTGAGKTEILTNISYQLLGQGVKQFVASVETGSEDYGYRLMGAASGIDGEALDALSIEELKAIKTSYDYLFENDNLYFTRYENRIPHRVLLAELLYAHETFGIEVALLDNLNFFLNIEDAKSQLVTMDKAIHDFVVFSKRVPIHTMLVMHPKKTETDAVKSVYDIKGSSTAIQEASNVILFNRLEEAQRMHSPKDSNPNTCRTLTFQKIRKRGYGKNVGLSILFKYERSRYEEVKCFRP